MTVRENSGAASRHEEPLASEIFGHRKYREQFSASPEFPALTKHFSRQFSHHTCNLTRPLIFNLPFHCRVGLVCRPQSCKCHRVTTIGISRVSERRSTKRKRWPLVSTGVIITFRTIYYFLRFMPFTPILSCYSRGSERKELYHALKKIC